MRTCGTCAVCCIVPEIPGVKRRDEACPNLEACGHGCKIYEARPGHCREYRCGWLMGLGLHADRPDKSGVLLEARDIQFGHRMIAKIVAPGPRAEKALRRMAGDDVIIVLAGPHDPKIERFVGSGAGAFRKAYGIA